MAQVKKFNTGGGLYLDGVKLTDEQINAAMDTLSAEDKYTWSKSIDKVRAGQRVDLNELGNSVTGGDFSHVLTDKQLEKNTSGNLNRRQRNRHARRGTAIDSTNRGIANGIAALKSQLNVPKEEVSSTKDLGYGSGWFTYGEDGSYTTGPTNASNERIIRDAFAYLAGDDNYRKGWTTNQYSEGLNGLVNWYNGQDANGLIDRIKTQSLTSEDRDVLSKLGFSESIDAANSKIISDLKTKFKNAGYDYDTWAPYVDFDEDGNLVARKDTNGQSVFAGLGGNGNYWFNESFVSSNPDYEFLKDHFLINGRIYKASDANNLDSDLYKYLRKSGGFYDLNNAGRYDDADALISYKWGNNSYIRPDNTTHLAGNFYNSGIRMDNTNYRTGDTKIVGQDYTLQDGDQIIRYVDLNTPSNEYGLRNDVYAIVDRYGNVRKGLSGKELRGLDSNYFSNLAQFGPLMTEEQIENQRLERIERVSTSDNELYYNRYKLSISPYYDLYIDPNTGDAIMEPKGELESKWLKGNNKGIKLSPEIAEILQKPEFIDALKNDPDFVKKFRNSIQSLTGTDLQDLFKRHLDSYKDFVNTDTDGLDDRRIIDFFYGQGSNAPGKSRAYTRRNADYIVDLPQSNKFGGKLPKFQSGGAINAGQKQYEHKSLVQQPVKSHTEQARIGIDKLSAAEKAELISIGMDVLGTITGLAGPVGDIAGSSLGLAASATQLGADISRAGRLTGKDAGRFLMNAGLDAVGLLPVFGDEARTAKTIKNIQRASKWLMPIFSTAGLSAAASSVGKIMKGETMTVDDWGNLAAGFQAITGIGSSVKQRWGKSKIASEMSKLPKNIETPQYKTKLGDKEVILKEGDIREITSKSKKDAEEYLMKILTDREGIKSEDIPKEILTKFGFKEGRTRWNKIGEQELPKEITDRSARRFFLTPGLDKYLDVNSNNISKVIPKFSESVVTQSGNNGVTMFTEKSSVSNKNVSRQLAMLAKKYDLDVPVTTRKKTGRNHWSYITPDIKEKARITPTVGNVLSEVNSRINELPSIETPDWIPYGNRWYKRPSPEMTYLISRVDLHPFPRISDGVKRNITSSLIPKSGVTQISYNTPKEKLRKSRSKYLTKKDVEKKISDNLILRDYSISLPEGRLTRRFTPEFSENLNAIREWGDEFDIRSGSRNTAAEANTMNLFVRFKKYQQALNNVNNEKSFRKIIANMGKDIEFKLAMEENPGLLREEMLAAASRSGILGQRRKLLLSSNDLNFKQGGKIQFAKNGKKITKHKNTSIVPSMWGNMYKTITEKQNPTVSNTTADINPISRNVAGEMLAEQQRQQITPGISTNQNGKVYTPVGLTALNTNYAENHDVTGTNATPATSYMSNFTGLEIEPAVMTATKTPTPAVKTPAVKTSGQGNPTGEKPQRNLSWEMLPALGSIASNYAISTNANKKQLALAKDTYNSTLRNLEQNVPEFYNRYSEAGVDQTFNDAATAIQSQANKARYADAGLNEAVRMEGAKQVSNLMLQKGQQKSQMFQNWLDKDNELRRNYALQRTAVENANRQRIAQADAYLNQQKGAAIAQQSAINQGALGDLKQVLNVPAQSRLQQQQTDIQRRYQDWLRGIQSEYNNGIDNKSIASGTTFDNWLAGNKTYMSQFRDYQDQLAGITAKANYLKFKSGGTIKHRPEKEQIRINQQKIVADAIKQLSKQAFEFLKMALS